MKKSILIGCFGAGFLLLTIPSITAIEAHAVQDAYEPTILGRIREILQSLRDYRILPMAVLLFVATLIGIVVGNPPLDVQPTVPGNPTIPQPE